MPRVDIGRMREHLRLYLVMGSANCGRDPLVVLEKALQGGVTLFQLREKGEGCLTGSRLHEFAQAARRLCHQYDVPFLVNDDVELALAVDADGVHLGQDDEPADRVRSRMGDKIIGVSVHSLTEAEQAVRAGADYAGAGPMFPTRSKSDAHPVQGPELVRRLRAGGASLPLVGIGGITADNAASVLQAGADGIAVISAISWAEAPREAAQSLRSILSRSML
ncbi:MULTISPECIES: thiamine phosphate synthase [Paenibacillus]|uniref:thiamine phosphate synthase n=1 Tax=Paenibacillus TaxID=44249 RepID=UPI0011EB6F09|nr:MULTISPECIES: thiamine phosphate synthase [Paenibacillus]MBE0335826.1 thiamine phosphate synthase [Paenibacillus sp. 23TSA30-6]